MVNSAAIFSSALVLALSSCALVSAQGTYCNSDKTVCVKGVFSTSTITFTVTSNYTGWAGFGIGSSMSDADVFVGWKNGSNFIVTDRTATGHSRPTLDSTQEIQFSSTTASSSITALDSSQSASGVRYTFTRSLTPKQSTNKAITSGTTMNYIWSGSNTAPANASSISGTFTKHDNKGTFSIDFSKAGTSSGSGSSTATGSSGSSGSTTTGGSSATGTGKSSAIHQISFIASLVTFITVACTLVVTSLALF